MPDTTLPIDSLIASPREGMHTLILNADEYAARLDSPLVTSAEKARISTARSASRRESFALGRSVLRLLVGNIANAEPSSIGIGIRDDGSIFLQGIDGHISLSHSGKSAAAVYSTRTPVGVDIEVVQQRRDDLYQYVLHPDEYHLLEESGLDNNEATILFWTLKEAVLKGRRSGLRHSPREIRLDLDFKDGTGRATVDDGDAWDLLFEQRNGIYCSTAFH